MKVLLFAAFGLCMVYAIVAESEDLDNLNEFEKLMLRRLASAKLAEEAEGVEEAVPEVALTDEQRKSNEVEEAAAVATVESCSKDSGNTDTTEGTENTENTEAAENADASKKNPAQDKLWVDSKSCCPYGAVYLDLRNNNKKIQKVDGITLLEKYGATGGGNGWWSPPSNECTAKALLKVNFQTLGDCASGCLSKPVCGRRMLKIVLSLSPQLNDRWGHMLNIGDSVSNNGWGGDFNHQLCDAELHGYYPYMSMYKSDKCKSYWYDNAVFSQILKRNNKITLYLSNEFIRIKEGNGQEHTICSHCLYCLNEQYDLPQNEDIYVSLNRVVHGAYRWGKGVCSASLSWECPCDW